MDRTLAGLLERDHFSERRMAFVSGPRQVGKTTLGRMLLERRGSADLYRNWDDLAWRREFSREPYAFLDAFRARRSGRRPLAVFDEVHRFPRWKRYLKGLWDTRSGQVDLLVTGSGRLDVYQKGGDSLLGRYHQYRMHPLSLHEVVAPAPPPTGYDPERTASAWQDAAGRPPKRVAEAFEQLLARGGFPEPFLRGDARRLRMWHRERRDLVLREDLRDLSRVQLVSHVEQLAELLVDRAAGVLSYSSLAGDLQVAVESVRQWVGLLGRLHMVYLVRPYARKLARAIRKEPKVYLWDWSEVRDEGARFENLLASHLLKWAHFTQDWGHPPLELHFVRDKSGREVDFLVTREGQPWLLVEAKRSATAPGPALDYFARRLGVRHRLLVVERLAAPGRAGDVPVLDAATFLSSLPV